MNNWELGFYQAKSGLYRSPLFPHNREYMSGWNCYVNEVLPEIIKAKMELCSKY